MQEHIKCVVGKKLGSYTLNISNLNHASGDFKVRDVSLERVDKLVAQHLNCSMTRLDNTPLVVLAECPIEHYTIDIPHIVIDGNHRLAAMNKLNRMSSAASPFRYTTVQCSVYVGLTCIEALSLGCNCNETASSAEPMSDAQKCILARNIVWKTALEEQRSDETVLEISSSKFQELYTVFNIDPKKVSEMEFIFY